MNKTTTKKIARESWNLPYCVNLGYDDVYRFYVNTSRMVDLKSFFNAFGIRRESWVTSRDEKTLYFIFKTSTDTQYVARLPYKNEYKKKSWFSKDTRMNFSRIESDIRYANYKNEDNPVAFTAIRNHYWEFYENNIDVKNPMPMHDVCDYLVKHQDDDDGHELLERLVNKKIECENHDAQEYSAALSDLRDDSTLYRDLQKKTLERKEDYLEKYKEYVSALYDFIDYFDKDSDKVQSRALELLSRDN